MKVWVEFTTTKVLDLEIQNIEDIHLDNMSTSESDELIKDEIMYEHGLIARNIRVVE